VCEKLQDQYDDIDQQFTHGKTFSAHLKALQKRICIKDINLKVLQDLTKELHTKSTSADTMLSHVLESGETDEFVDNI